MMPAADVIAMLLMEREELRQAVISQIDPWTSSSCLRLLRAKDPKSADMLEQPAGACFQPYDCIRLKYTMAVSWRSLNRGLLFIKQRPGATAPTKDTVKAAFNSLPKAVCKELDATAFGDGVVWPLREMFKSVLAVPYIR